jgi:hypothetical protein
MLRNPGSSPLMVLVNVDGASDEAGIQLWLPLIEIALRASTTIWSPPKKILFWATSRAFGSYSWTNLILGLPAISVLWNRYNVPLCLPPSQGVRSFGLRQARYIELAKTHLQNIFTAVAINIVRFSNWVSEVPLAKIRTFAFEALRPMAA